MTQPEDTHFGDSRGFFLLLILIKKKSFGFILPGLKMAMKSHNIRYLMVQFPMWYPVTLPPFRAMTFSFMFQQVPNDALPPLLLSTILSPALWPERHFHVENLS